jgi:hypothetical protein
MLDQFFGQFLIHRGIITPAQLNEALEYQNRLNRRIGTIAVERKMLGKEDVGLILEQQRSWDLPFGEIGERLALLTPKQRRLLSREQERSFVYLGEVLLALGLLSTKQYTELLPEFQEREESMRRKIESTLEDSPPVKVILSLLLDTIRRCTGQPVKIENVEASEAPAPDSVFFTMMVKDCDLSFLLAVPQLEHERFSSLFPDGSRGFCSMLSDYLPARMEGVGLGACRCEVHEHPAAGSFQEGLRVSLITPASRFLVLFRTPAQRL